MNKLILAVCASLFILTGCTEQQIDSAKSAAETTLKATCEAYPISYAAYNAITMSLPANKQLSAKNKAIVEAAYASLKNLCDNKPTNVASAVLQAGTAYASITAAVASAKRAAPAQ